MGLVITEALTPEKLAKVFDHAILRPEQTTEDVIKGCNVAKEYNLASVCVKPCDVRQASELLQGTDVMVGTVISFPHVTLVLLPKSPSHFKLLKMVLLN